VSELKKTAEPNRNSTKPARARAFAAAIAPAKRPMRKERKSDKVKSDKLVCRYCGSADLSPSFINRRDRRCRKCFSKRYGTAARARKTRKRK
jgi:hypothetical protein